MSQTPDAMTKVVEENGRWIVWLNVPRWNEPHSSDRNSTDHPIENCWHRINDYPTREAAELAAKIICRNANKNSPPNQGF